jgi:hypothetical protein
MPAECAVYVTELSRKVYRENWKSRAANPQYNGVLECLYVGIVKKYGRYLRPSLHQHIEPLSRVEALEVEKGSALELRRKGYAVWTN